MADLRKSTNGPAPFSADAWDPKTLPDYDDDLVNEDDIAEFVKALAAPEISPSEEDLTNPSRQPTEFITALNDWRPIHQKVKGRQKQKTSKKKRPPRRGKDETREGWTYNVLKYPLLLVVLAWLFALGVGYLLTRFYISLYEQIVTWRGRRQRLRTSLGVQTNYQDWVKAAKQLDTYLGSDEWKETDEYAYYDCKTVRRVKERMRKLRMRAEGEEHGLHDGNAAQRPIDDLRGLVEACVKNNFAGFENPRLYSETYFGTKRLVQEYVDEVAASLDVLLHSTQLTQDDKRSLSKHLSTNFGRTALCLSGGATFAYYHFGIAKALLDANLLPQVITGTSGGALVAGLLATRTDEELKKLLIPALAYRITACRDPWWTWARRWYSTGARFDSVDWARRCSWFCHGSLTFLEAYQRTGRILNVSCVPSDPHSPTILANYLTAPDCVIWSAVLASAAVPGILNPVVLMRKTRDGKLEPYSFGHKWKDGSLRTDIPLKALNLHFNVNFSIVSQVNPHINIFFFSSRGSIGRPVTHRKGRGWRGGFLGSALEQYLKLDLTKWLKVLRHLELLPRPLGQDWSEVWLQRFSGTITIWPKSLLSDFYYILSDPTMDRLARMIHVGQQAAFPKLNFIANRIKIERVIEEARRAARSNPHALPTPNLQRTEEMRSMLSEDDLRGLLSQAHHNGGKVAAPPPFTLRPVGAEDPMAYSNDRDLGSARAASPSLSKRLTGWFGGASGRSSIEAEKPMMQELRRKESLGRRTSVIHELGRQSRVFLDDVETDGESAEDSNREDVAPYVGAPPGVKLGREYEYDSHERAAKHDFASPNDTSETDSEVEEERREEAAINALGGQVGINTRAV